jgi:hypothetical protein
MAIRTDEDMKNILSEHKLGWEEDISIYIKKSSQNTTGLWALHVLFPSRRNENLMKCSIDGKPSQFVKIVRFVNTFQGDFGTLVELTCGCTICIPYWPCDKETLTILDSLTAPPSDIHFHAWQIL